VEDLVNALLASQDELEVELPVWPAVDLPAEVRQRLDAQASDAAVAECVEQRGEPTPDAERPL